MQISRIAAGLRRKPVSNINHAQLRSWWERFTRAVKSPTPLTPGSFPTFPEVRFDPDSFARDYLLSEVLSKLDDGSKSPEKTRVTWERFFLAEEMCARANERLRRPSIGSNCMSEQSDHAVIHLAGRMMERLLGRFDWNEAAAGFAWGPGASTRLKRAKASVPEKFNGRPESTIGNVALACAAIAAHPVWRDSLKFEEGSGYCDIVPGNHIVTVPKSYKTDRVIAIEPDMNMFVQKGIGRVIRRRLRKVGIDLDDQSRNQRLAVIGSFAGTLATIDLSMASDTVSQGIVERLLPPDWLMGLEQTRSPVGRLPCEVAESRGIPETWRFHKFSSMGNGYTFELETAIFCCLAWAVAEIQGCEDNRISVYGDDIIVPVSIAPRLIEVLRTCGFAPNEKKTFVSGGFRESCGIHALNGYDVTPFYVKAVPKTLMDLFLLHNQLYRWCIRVTPVLDVAPFQALLRELRSMAPPQWRRPRLPDGFGDGAFIGTFDECVPRRAPHFIEGFIVEHMVAVARPQRVQPEHAGRLLASLYALERADGHLDREGSVPDRPRIRTVRSLVPQFALISPF